MSNRWHWRTSAIVLFGRVEGTIAKAQRSPYSVHKVNVGGYSICGERSVTLMADSKVGIAASRPRRQGTESPSWTPAGNRVMDFSI